MSGPAPIVALIIATVAMLHHPSAAKSQERMQLGAFAATLLSEFRDLAGDRVFFGEGSSELGARARTALAAQAAWLRRNAGLPVIVEGHADDGGSGEQNLSLSQRRADAVRQRLIEAGVGPERIRTVAYGKLRLLAECTNAVCAAQNRRVITIIGHHAPAVQPEAGPSSQPQDAGPRSPRRLF